MKLSIDARHQGRLQDERRKGVADIIMLMRAGLMRCYVCVSEERNHSDACFLVGSLIAQAHILVLPLSTVSERIRGRSHFRCHREEHMMLITRGYRTELDLNNKQITLCKKHAGVARFSYNWGLNRKQEVYQETGRSISAIELHRELNALKQTEYPWMYIP